jgi:hypothetical protein
VATRRVSLSGMQSGCMSLGPRTFKADQVDYSRALGDSKKRQILALIVGLRYADAPAFLNVSQIIAGYTFTASATAVANSTPDPGGPGAGLTGMASYSDHPTFTFTPITGESYAKAYIHPLLPAKILPLADGGVPIDLLLRIAVQSIGGLSNAAMLGGPSGNGSPGFFRIVGRAAPAAARRRSVDRVRARPGRWLGQPVTRLAPRQRVRRRHEGRGPRA